MHYLHSNRIDPDAQVVITTIQRLYAMARGEELDESAEETSAFATCAHDEGEIPPSSLPVFPDGCYGDFGCIHSL